MVGLLIGGNECNNDVGDRLVSGSLCGDDRSISVAFAIDLEKIGVGSKVGLVFVALSIRIKPVEQACEK